MARSNCLAAVAIPTLASSSAVGVRGRRRLLGRFESGGRPFFVAQLGEHLGAEKRREADQCRLLESFFEELLRLLEMSPVGVGIPGVKSELRSARACACRNRTFSWRTFSPGRRISARAWSREIATSRFSMAESARLTIVGCEFVLVGPEAAAPRGRLRTGTETGWLVNALDYRCRTDRGG